MEHDTVFHPAHYETGNHECFDVMQETQGTKAVISFCICNAFKYIYRHSRKGQLEDIKKADWYLRKAIGLAENTETSISDDISANEYQELAGRTISNNLLDAAKEEHALHGMVGEIGELHSIYQKYFQGHVEASEEHLKKELGDLLWFVAEYCTSRKWKLSEIMKMNIDKLKKRYPNGFEVEKSRHRQKGDI